MNTTEEQITKKKRIVPKGRIKMTVKRNFIGDKSMIDALMPIITEDIKVKIESHTFDLSA